MEGLLAHLLLHKAGSTTEGFVLSLAALPDAVAQMEAQGRYPSAGSVKMQLAQCPARSCIAHSRLLCLGAEFSEWAHLSSSVTSCANTWSQLQ